LVKAHGGRIDVASETGKGTTVGVTIPDAGAGCDGTE
jgi:signal transduction histidine kinase